MVMQQVIQHIHGICPTAISLRYFCKRYVFFCGVVYIYVHTICTSVSKFRSKTVSLFWEGKKKKRYWNLKCLLVPMNFTHSLRASPRKGRTYQNGAVLRPPWFNFVLSHVFSWVSIAPWKDICLGLETSISTLNCYIGKLKDECILTYTDRWETWKERKRKHLYVLQTIWQGTNVD